MVARKEEAEARAGMQKARYLNSTEAPQRGTNKANADKYSTGHESELRGPMLAIPAERGNRERAVACHCGRTCPLNQEHLCASWFVIHAHPVDTRAHAHAMPISREGGPMVIQRGPLRPVETFAR
ncbi:hypothetical protein KM043_008250 [Ampulex compressa]|nr:hypothetical protein KM043_008250 [Ampulex compressa]